MLHHQRGIAAARCDAEAEQFLYLCFLHSDPLNLFFIASCPSARMAYGRMQFSSRKAL
jgi:hypothetical protein